MFRARTFLISLLAACLGSLALTAPALGNDAMFPAEAAAAQSIGWKNNYFVVDGKPVIVSAGEIHYARVPRELWRERLVKMKRAGINTISTYSFWNAHEPEPGVFNFEDNLDLDAWLSEIEAVGLYAIARPGPYNCAEWLAGGIPQWITAKGMRIRDDSADFLAAADRYYEKIIPIIAEHQIHKGGRVLWMQIENEHPNGWGTEGNAYLKHLYDKARALGMEVPLYYSGMHHATDPAGTTPFGNRTYPWYSSEFWSGWFSLPFGEMNANDLNVLQRGAWKVIAFGGGGNTFYVSHGGTNFGYSGDTATTSYDYRAPLGEASQLRQGYFAVRRAESFARAFEALMGNSQDGGSATVSGGLKTYVRKSPNDGVAVFLDNQGGSAVQTKVKLNSPSVEFPSGNTQISVASNEIRPVVASVPWTANATFAYLATNVLGKLAIGTKTYWVCHGRAGESGEIAVQYTNAPSAAPAAPWDWDASAKLGRATFTYPSGDTITELELESGDGSSATFLVINSPLADRTWITDEALHVGATYVDDDLSIQVPMAGGKVTVYSAEGPSDVTIPAATAPQLPALGSWQWRDAAAEAQPDYDDSTWASSPEPQPFGASDFQNGYGWYRAKFNAGSAGNVTATIGGIRSAAKAFANGTQVRLSSSSFSFNAVAGENTVAILAKHEGLDKMYNVTGSTGTGQYAGIWGGVNNGGSALASSWKFRGGLGGMDETGVVGLVNNWDAFLDGAWAPSAAIQSSPSFWRADFPSPLEEGMFATVGLRTSGLSWGSVWVNGHNIGRFSNNTLLYVPECWLGADNTVVIYDESGNAPTGVKLEYIETRARYASGTGGTGGTGGSGGTGGAGGNAGATATGGRGGPGGASGSGGANGGSSTGGRGGSGGAVTPTTGGSAGSGGTVTPTTGGSAGSGGAGVSGAGVSGAGGAASGAGGSAAAGGTQQGTGGRGSSGQSAGGGGGTQGSGDTGGTTDIAHEQSGSDGGCACAVGSSSRSHGVWLALSLLLFRRRPRAAPGRKRVFRGTDGDGLRNETLERR
ncbi:MAG: beta-galactosidase [Polyangiaceae bacterium]|nr:beta-galactosidase [Polyangiaceae bacterium]